MPVMQRVPLWLAHTHIGSFIMITALRLPVAAAHWHTVTNANIQRETNFLDRLYPACQ